MNHNNKKNTFRLLIPVYNDADSLKLLLSKIINVAKKN